MSYRGEQSLPDEELFLRDANKTTFTYQPAFLSTSKDKDVSKSFASRALIEFRQLIGKNVNHLTFANLNSGTLKDEYELVSLPTLMMWKRVRDTVNTKQSIIPQYHATPIIPLIDSQKLITTDEIKALSSLLKIANQHSVTIRSDSSWIENLKCLINPNFLHALNEVYNHYLSLPYSNTFTKNDWDLSTDFGKIHRPNHGLAHTLRVAMLIPHIIQLNHFDFALKEIQELQLVALFFVAGRENDCGFSDNPNLYQIFRKNSAEAFKVFAKDNLQLTDAQIKRYYNLLINEDYHQANAQSVSLESLILNLAHKLDLIRCYPDDILNKTLFDDPRIMPYSKTINDLLDIALNQIVATGDRVKSHGTKHSYQLPLFYDASTNPAYCLTQILNSNMPTLADTNKSDHDLKPNRSKL